MFLLVLAHPGCPGQNPESRKMVVVVVLVCCARAALRYTTTDGQWKESAIRLTNTMVNVHAIINHFGPKIESWTTAHNLSSLTEEQVSLSLGTVVKTVEITDVFYWKSRLEIAPVPYISLCGLCCSKMVARDSFQDADDTFLKDFVQ